MVRSQHIYS